MILFDKINIIIEFLFYSFTSFFSGFIRPVCLPFNGDHQEMTDEVWLKLTGWGFVDGAMC